MGTVLQDAGYTTGYAGKYLNGYDELIDQKGFPYIPPGWDDWFAFVAGNNNNFYYYDYTVNDNGTIVAYGTEPSDYGTDVTLQQAIAFIEAQSGSENPFFLTWHPPAPHAPFVPADRHAGAFAGLPSWDVPSVNFVAPDQPDFLNELPEIPQEVIDETRQLQLETMLAVDEGIEALIALLDAEGVLDETVIIFTTDNGFFWGEHRQMRKRAAYEEAARAPLVVRYPGLSGTPATIEEFVLNIDLAPTIAAMGGTSMPPVDGEDFTPLLLGTAESWRTDFLIEHWPDDPPADYVPQYVALRSEKWKYIAYKDTGEEELYNLFPESPIYDPYEMDNLIDLPQFRVIADEALARIEEIRRTMPYNLSLPVVLR
jgi:arylsulfatase A-like enzyme